MNEHSNNIKEIYFAGGCFWGVEKYFSMIDGVVETNVGYANGTTPNPSYEDVCYRNTGHVETVRVLYDKEKVSLGVLLELFYEIIDPTSINRQGGDKGTQYRTGVYYVDKSDEIVISRSFNELQKKYSKSIAIEVLPMQQYYPAEAYHQKYLEKNSNGYCHIGKDKFEKAGTANQQPIKYKSKSKEELQKSLTQMQFNVTQNAATEPSFNNEYYSNFKKGIYVDITTGEPLFVSSDKFDSGCGWPSFAKPINAELIDEIPDYSHGIKRVEVRSKSGNAHLGHVFDDGPIDKGGLRYCINSASLLFIPIEEMKERGYEYLLNLL